MAARRPPGHSWMNRASYEGGTVTREPIVCRCGWTAPEAETKRRAREVYQDHLRTAPWRCGCGETDPAQRAEGERAKCKTCETARVQAWKNQNREHWKKYGREANYLARYGITIEQYDAMLTAQGGGCAVCQITPDRSPKRFHVDHCHETGRVRGILCFACNSGLGAFSDNPDRMRRAATYLEIPR